MDQADELLPTHGLITLVADRGLPTEASPAAPACLADPAELPKYERECQASNGADVESIKRDSAPADLADLADPCLRTPFCTVSRRPAGPLAPPTRRARLRSR